ncbi:threonine-phosphate decarboxylase CobD [Thioclava sp. GXIMD4216]|uniref:threonine-phosphate decarboxylase CobD n=1 Tax=Thioclava sp. GXIMD4216 TaxID=3131929 RepID=UPI0030CF2E56
MRDHGGNLDQAMAIFGGDDWIDLSTGINRVPYPVPALPSQAYTDLPTRSAMEGLLAVARRTYGLKDAAIAALAGAQAAIQTLPHIVGGPKRARVLGPTYNEHAASLRQAGWEVQEVTTIAELRGADLAVVVNPNNPDGQSHPATTLLALRQEVGALVVDESFADPRPDLSVVAHLGAPDLFVLRSFGKFYGQAGLRLGFVLGAEAQIAQIRQMAGPWPVCGAALVIGQQALADTRWQQQTCARLHEDVIRMDSLAQRAGWQRAGGAELFRLYETPDATGAQTRLARARIWSRIFPWHPRWIRLGLPGSAQEWARLEAVLTGEGQ